MATYEDDFGDFGPLRMTPKQIEDLYRTLPPVEEAIAQQDRLREQAYAEVLRRNAEADAQVKAEPLPLPKAIAKGLAFLNP